MTTTKFLKDLDARLSVSQNTRLGAKCLTAPPMDWASISHAAQKLHVFFNLALKKPARWSFWSRRM